MEMSVRRIAAAALVLAAALYLRALMPELSGQLFPAMRQAIALGQVELTLPEGVAAWLGWN